MMKKRTKMRHKKHPRNQKTPSLMVSPMMQDHKNPVVNHANIENRHEDQNIKGPGDNESILHLHHLPLHLLIILKKRVGGQLDQLRVEVREVVVAEWEDLEMMIQPCKRRTSYGYSHSNGAQLFDDYVIAQVLS